MRNKISKLLGMLALGVSSLLPVHVARADDTPAPKAVPVPVVRAPKQESRPSPVVLTSRQYSDENGSAGQEILEGPFGKIVYSEYTPVVKYGANLKLGDMFKDGNLYRINFGRITDDDKDTEKSRVSVEVSRSDGVLDFLSAEYQDLNREDVYSASIGLRLGPLKLQGTANSEGEYGYAALLRTGENSNVGVGGRHTRTADSVNAAFDVKFTEGPLSGNRLTGHVNYTDPVTGNETLEARVRYGDKAPAGAFLSDVKDSDLNTLSTVNDTTFIPSFGNFDQFGAASSISGRAGTFGIDIKYKDNGTDRVLSADAAIGIGSVTDTWFKDIKLQAGYRLNFDDSSKDMFSAEVRGTIYESRDGSFQIGGGIRYENPATGSDNTSAFLGLTLKL